MKRVGNDIVLSTEDVERAFWPLLDTIQWIIVMQDDDRLPHDSRRIVIPAFRLWGIPVVIEEVKHD